MADPCPRCRTPVLNPWVPIGPVWHLINGNTHERTCQSCGAREQANLVRTTRA